ncbi:MAG TPA: aminopeptidase [Chromatiales bacterium]|nr:aminopeptidase [Thiotrichales bacterium]HIP67202.1 aminopeptidase [Chromatiales bacterium]
MKIDFLKFLLLSMLALVAISSCVGCSTVGYYAQGITGHLALMHQREPIDELLENEGLEKSRQEQLQAAQTIRDFASQQLGLPDNGSYRSYVELDRDYVVWNVVATPAFSLKPLEWCFPIAGCVSYRGYFSREDAEAFAAELKRQGHDVVVNPVPAYSTLGWFDDPVLSSMIHQGELLLAQTIFHELAHQQLYVKDDSVFNEAFASTVGEQGVFRWLKEAGRIEDLVRYQKYLTRKGEFLDLLKQTSEELQQLYQQKLPTEKMRTEKAALFARLRENYNLQKNRWGGYEGYDRWFDRELNNARLASIAVYRDRVPDFVRWLDVCDGKFPKFYAAMKQLGKQEKQARQKRLQGPADCSG